MIKKPGKSFVAGLYGGAPSKAYERYSPGEAGASHAEAVGRIKQASKELDRAMFPSMETTPAPIPVRSDWPERRVVEYSSTATMTSAPLPRMSTFFESGETKRSRVPKAFRASWWRDESCLSNVTSFGRDLEHDGKLKLTFAGIGSLLTFSLLLYLDRPQITEFSFWAFIVLGAVSTWILAYLIGKALPSIVRGVSYAMAAVTVAVSILSVGAAIGVVGMLLIKQSQAKVDAKHQNPQPHIHAAQKQVSAP